MPMKTLKTKCSVAGCSKDVYALRKGLCRSHYEEQLRNDPSRPKCKVEGCERRAVKKDTCLPHYRRQELENIKNTLFEILGGKKCVVCGFTDERALTFDHIYDDGYLDRGSGPGGASQFVKYVKSHLYPAKSPQRLQSPRLA